MESHITLCLLWPNRSDYKLQASLVRGEQRWQKIPGLLIFSWDVFSHLSISYSGLDCLEAAQPHCQRSRDSLMSLIRTLAGAPSLAIPRIQMEYFQKERLQPRSSHSSCSTNREAMRDFLWKRLFSPHWLSHSGRCNLCPIIGIQYTQSYLPQQRLFESMPRRRVKHRSSA